MDPETTWAHIRQHTAGRRIVVVTNRVDKPLKRTLETLLATRLKWVVCRPRKISSLAQSIKHGTYDIVLAFTGWMDHKNDTALARASSDSDTLYVRGDKGRPTAVMLALSRDLGID